MKSPGRGGKGVSPKGDKVRDPIFTRGDINLNILIKNMILKSFQFSTRLDENGRKINHISFWFIKNTFAYMQWLKEFLWLEYSTVGSASLMADSTGRLASTI
jgi:hypothetical protein